MRVTRRQLRNLINEVLQEQGVDPDSIDGSNRSRKENDKKLFLYLNRVGKTATPNWTFSLGSASVHPGKEVHGEIHFIDTVVPPGSGSVTDSYWEELRSEAQDALDVFNRKNSTDYYTVNAQEGSRLTLAPSNKYLVLPGPAPGWYD